MSQGPVIIDPKSLRMFISQLKAFNGELQASSSRLGSQMRQLGETWRDPAYQKFNQEFDQLIRSLRHFQQVSDGQIIPLLQRTAERAEEVHR